MHVPQFDDAEPFESTGSSMIRELAGRASLPSRCCSAPWSPGDTVLTGG